MTDVKVRHCKVCEECEGDILDEGYEEGEKEGERRIINRFESVMIDVKHRLRGGRFECIKCGKRHDNEAHTEYCRPCELKEFGEDVC